MPPSVAEPCVFSVRVSAEGAAAFPLPPFANCKGFVPELKNILRILLVILLLLLLLLFIVVVALVVEEEKVLFPASNPRPKCATRLDVLSLLVFSSRENDARPPLPSSSSLLLRMASSEDAKKGRLVPIASLPLPLAAEPEKSVDVKKEEHKDGADQTLFLEDDQSAEENAPTARRWERIIVRVFLLRSFVFPKKNFSTRTSVNYYCMNEESNDATPKRV